MSSKEPRIRNRRFLMKVSRHLDKNGERLRDSEREVAVSSGAAGSWDSFAGLIVPVGVAVVIAVASLAFTFLATGNSDLTQPFAVFAGILSALFVLMLVWILVGGRNLRVHIAVREIALLRNQHRFELDMHDSVERGHIRRRRAIEDPFVFDPHRKPWWALS